MSPSLAEHLKQARHARFVGCEGELNLFSWAVRADHTYFHPAATQEAAAEQLDLPVSTYRRHLTAGIQRLTEMLWQQEIGER